MRFRIALWIVSMLMSHTLWSSEYDSLFQVATAQYQAGEYEKSHHVFHGLVLEGFQSHSLFYNYANACLQSDRLPESIAFYEKSLQIDPKDISSQNNLAYARKLLHIDEYTAQPWQHRHSTILYTLAILAFWLTLAAWIWQLTSTPKRPARPILWAGTILSCVVLFFSARTYIQKNIYQYGIAQTDAYIYQDSFSYSQQTYELFAGQKFRILTTKSGWHRIRTEQGRTGWLPASEAIEI